MGARPEVKLGGPPGAHLAYLRDDGALVVEWYDFGDHAPYESANLLVFTSPGQQALAERLGASPGQPAAELLAVLGERFDSYFEVRAFADAHMIPYQRLTDFWP